MAARYDEPRREVPCPVATCELIVTADDYGLTDATSRAIIEAHQQGMVTATSVLAVAPGIEERLRWLAEAPALSTGVHLALVGEDAPLLTAVEIPTLVDASGRFRRSWRQLLPLLAAGRVDPADVRRELGAQVEALRAHVQPTHLDSHQHLHLWPSVAAVVVELALEHGIGAVRVPRSTGRGPRARGIDALARRLAARLDAAGLAHTDRFCGLDEAGGWTSEQLVAVLASLGTAGGSVECNVHPGADVDPERSRFAWGYAWAQERAALCDPDLRRRVEQLGFVLVGR
jgi:predicted glycoside hydrolase/deacetylase ChbG (UPF0249 family)